METPVSLISDALPLTSVLPVVTSSFKLTLASPSTFVTEGKLELQRRVYSCNNLVDIYGT